MLNLILTSILFADYLERKYPFVIVKLKNLAIDVSYNLIYFYSKCQLFFQTNSTFLKMSNFVTRLLSVDNDLEFLFVKDCFHYNVEVENPDLIVVTFLNSKKIITNLTELSVLSITDDFKESDIKFMLVEFKIGETVYKIDLKTEKFNYYIIGNKFNRDFFIYYINNYILSKYERHEYDACEKYILKIIDHDVNTLEINFSDKDESILLLKSKYELSIINH